MLYNDVVVNVCSKYVVRHKIIIFEDIRTPRSGGGSSTEDDTAIVKDAILPL